MQNDTAQSPRGTAGAFLAGDLHVDLGRQRVQRDGVTIALPKLSFDVLVALIRAEPNVVSNEELMSIAWPGIVVSPETVTQRLKLLRDSLGDDPRQPRYIEGLRSRGYRFMQPVTLPPDSGRTEALVPAVAMATKPRRKLWWWSALALVVVAVGAAMLAIHGAGSNAPPAATAANLEFDRSVAVLPFELLNPGASEQYVGPGLAEAVLSRLSGVQGLTVIARDSSFRYGASNTKLAELSRLLGARYFVAGSAQKLGEQLRVNVRLIDGPTQAQLWSQQFTRPMLQLFNLQDDIGGSVAGALDERIAHLGQASRATGHSPNPQAYLAYLRGRSLLGRFTISDAEAAAAELTRAVAIDPSFGAAYVSLYDARMQSASLRREDKSAARRRYRSLIDQAALLDASPASLLYARAMWDDEDAQQARKHFEQAAQLDPNNGRGLTAYAQFLLPREPDESQRVLARALRVDPQSPRANFQAAMLTFPKVGAGIEQSMLQVLELDPKFYPALMRYAKYLWQMHGEAAQAIAMIERAIADDPENPWGRHLAAAFYIDIGDPVAAENVVAGYAVCEASTRVLFAQYRHDWRAAGQAALEKSSYEFAGPERWGVATALRDLGLQASARQQAEQELSNRYRLPPREPWTISVDNFREAQYLAQLYLADGRRDDGAARLRSVLAWIDANEKFGPVYNLRTKARALMLLGQKDAALATLAESFRQRDYTQWRYTFDADPTWDPVRHDPRFHAIELEVQEWLSGQKAALASLRADGAIPVRGPVR